MEFFRQGQTVEPGLEYLASFELHEIQKQQLAEGGKFVIPDDQRVAENDLWKMTFLAYHKIYVVVALEFKKIIHETTIRCDERTVNISGILNGKPLGGQRRIKA